jgi:hypothetical protein
MKTCSQFALLAALAAVALVAASPSRGQTGTSAPIVVKQTSPKRVKSVWLKAEVVHADRVSIVVREIANPVVIHTFTFSDGLKPKMESLADQGGFQSGDKIKILYQPGQSVALKLHGKPSKPR